MSFSSPIYLLGLLAMLIPLLIHLWRRRRAKRVWFSAIRFLLKTEQITRRQRRFWEYLLLLARMLLIGALSIALAGPFWEERVASLNLGSEPKALVLVLDDSMSMQRKKEGEVLFEQAKAMAVSFLDQLSELDQAGLVIPGIGLEILPGKDRDQVRKAIKSSSASWQRVNLLSATEKAERLLGQTGLESKKIILLTDLQETGFRFSNSLRQFEGEVYIYDLSGDESGSNLSVSQIDLSRSGLSGEQSIRIKARIHNYSKERAEVYLSLWLGEEVVSRGTAQIEGWSSEEKAFLVNLRENLNAEGRVEISSVKGAKDELSLDNYAYFHLQTGERIRALIVDGDWSNEPLARESYFLERALNPRLYALSRIDPIVVSETGFMEQDLTGVKVVALANCVLDQAMAQRLKAFVNAGGGLLITLGERVSAERYNRILGDLLVRELRETKVSFAGAESADNLQPGHIDSSFISDQLRHQILKPFKSAEQGDPGLAGFYKFFLFYQELVPRGEVILQLTDRTPLLLEKAYGKGRVMVFASTIDEEWNDLCIHPAFLPLVHQIVLYLAGSLIEPGAKIAEVGNQIELLLPENKDAVLLRTSKGTELRFLPEREGGIKVVRIQRLAEPGIYYFWYLPTLEPGNKSKADYILAVNLSPEESDLRKISIKELKKIIPAQGVYFEGERLKQTEQEGNDKFRVIKKPIHHSFLLALVILLGMEMLILARSGRE